MENCIDNKINISIVIPVYNRKDFLRKSLISVFEDINQGSHTDIEVIVIDDGSTEDLKDCVDQFPVRYYRLNKNSGPSAARNFGTNKAKGNIVFFIDSDVLLQKGVLSYLKNGFKTNKDVVAVQGNYTKHPQPRSFFSRYKNGLLHHNFSTSNKKSGIGIATFCVAIKKDVLEEFHGFNENIKKASIEDEELGVKIFSNEKKILFNNLVQVEHMKRYNFFKLLKQDFNTSFFKIKSILENKFFTVNGLKGSHLGIRYLSTIPISNFILLNLVLLFFINSPWIKANLVALTILYVLLGLDLYYYFSKEEGIIFTIKSILFSFIHNLVITIAVLVGFADFVIKGKE